MTPRENVIRAARFEGPERIPYNLSDSYGSDFLYVWAENDPNRMPRARTENEWEDEFGCIWEKLPGDKTMGQVKVHPLSDYAALNTIQFPDYKNPVRYENAEHKIKENREDRFVIASAPISFIHRLEYLRGHQEAWTDPYEHPESLRALLDRLADIAIDAIDRFAEIRVDGIFSCDDWGLQDRPMVKPDLFVEFWKPYYHRVYHHAHARGLLTFLHSCGHISTLLPHLIEAELDVIQMDQQENMGIDYLSEQFGGKLCFWCPVDIQHTMIQGSVEDVRLYARRLMESFGRFNGGFIAQWYASSEAVQHSWEKINAMSEEFVEYGRDFYK